MTGVQTCALPIFQSSTLVATLATSGVVLGAAYMLYLYRRVIFGKLEKEDLKSILDLSWREVAVFAPLVVLTIWMGVYPVSFTRPMHVSIVNLVTKYETAQVPRPSTVADARR